MVLARWPRRKSKADAKVRIIPLLMVNLLHINELMSRCAHKHPCAENGASYLSGTPTPLGFTELRLFVRKNGANAAVFYSRSGVLPRRMTDLYT